MTKKTRPGWFLFAVGVIYPAGVIGFEIVEEMCAKAFFDPIPTFGHVLLVSLVPLSNFLVWHWLRNESHQHLKTLGFLSALSIGVAAFYTITFLPITPIAFLGIVFYGIGLLPLAPLAALIIAIILCRRLRKVIVVQQRTPARLWQGLSVGVLALIIFDIPSIATHQGIQWAASDDRETSLRGVRVLRYIGDEEILLRRCYDQSGRISGPIGAFRTMGGNGGRYVSTAEVREIYFRVTGEPFNLKPPPYTDGQWQRMNRFAFDADQGGTEVGGRVKGLHLISSRIDGSMSSIEGVAYLEWTLEFQNDSALQREVRLQLALPPQGVASRATLWVNGEERESAFAGRAKATQAYQSVVNQRRDPLLVTTTGIDRLQAHAFPLPPNGGTIKFRLGITAPLELQGRDQTRLVLPAIVDRNFVIGDNVSHTVWVEGQHPLASTLPDPSLQNISPTRYRVTASLDDTALSESRRVITSKRDPVTTPRWAQVDGQPAIVQTVVRRAQGAADALMIVLDGGAGTAAFVAEIETALAQIPPNSRVGLIIAGETESALPIDEWSPSHAKKIKQTIAAHDFVGGQDNAPALTDALRALEHYEDGELLWIHLPQPVDFKSTSVAFEQALGRLSHLPQTSLYSLKSGPNSLLDNADWALWSKTIPNVGDPAKDLGDFFTNRLTATTHYAYVRRAASDVEKLEKGSTHIARLWARDQIQELVRGNSEDYLENAIKLAASYQLVTAVSGAVVLENADQYEENDLRPVTPNSVPTIPEPEQWLLALIIFAMMLWMTRQNVFNRNIHAR